MRKQHRGVTLPFFLLADSAFWGVANAKQALTVL